MIALLTTLIKRLKPHRYTTLHVEFPITLPRDCSPSEYEYLSSAEIESKALTVYTILVNTYGVKPKRMRGTIVPVLSTSTSHLTTILSRGVVDVLRTGTIVVKCEVPEDAPIILIGDDCIQIPGSNCMFFA